MKISRFILLPVVAVSMTALMLWHSQLPSPPPDSSIEQVRKEALRGGYRLIDTDKLWDWYQTDADSVLLVDTRQEWEYRTGHIKGALNFSMEPTWWARWRARGALENLLGDDKDRSIVFY